MITPFEELKTLIENDSSYAWAWHCNLAVPMKDEGIDHETANRAAARIMSTMFGIDTSKFKEYMP